MSTAATQTSLFPEPSPNPPIQPDKTGTFWTMVREFHTTFDLFIATRRTFATSAKRRLRLRLIQEEFGEYFTALQNKDAAGIVDGVVDTLYVVIGTALTHGVYLPAADRTYIPSFFSVPTNAFVEATDFARALAAYATELVGDGDLERLTTVVGDLYLHAIRLAAVHGIDLPLAFLAVHKSNMTKVGGYKDKGGKWIKPPTYRPVNWEAVLSKMRPVRIPL